MRNLGRAHLMATVVGMGLLVLLIAAPSADAGSRRSDCGGANQRPCNFWEALPSCDSNLKEDFFQNRCVAPPSSGGGGGSGSGPAQCGNEGQRPCTIFEAFPSCDPGLVENFLDNRCVQPGGGKQLGDVVDSFVPPNCADIFDAAAIFAIDPPGLNRNPLLPAILAKLRSGLGTNLNALYNYKLGPGAVADFVWDATIPKDSIATPLRVIGAVAYYATLYCGLTLERDVALESELALQENFDAVKDNVTQVKQSVADVKTMNTTITNDVATLTMKITNDVAALDGKITNEVGALTTKISNDVAALKGDDMQIQQAIAGLASSLTALDAQTKQQLTVLEARLLEVIRLLNTPPGRRADFNQ